MSKSTAVPSDTSQMQSSMMDSAQMSSQMGNRDSQASNARVSGGRYKSYIEDHLHRMHHDIESTTRKLELERRRLHGLDEALASAKQEYNSKRGKYKIFQSADDDAAKKAEQNVKLLEGRLVKFIAELNRGNRENEKIAEHKGIENEKKKDVDDIRKKLEKERQ